MDMRYRCSVAAVNALAAEGYVDLSEDDVNFIKQDRIWTAADRSRVRRGLEAFAYGAVDLLGLARFPLPAEFVATVIAKVVAAPNWQIACVIMSGAEWSENVVLNREDPVNAEVLFSHVLRIAAGFNYGVDNAEARARQAVPENEEAA